ncbi:hypothetical protein Q5P01_007948 [Channa striata]|uniref:Sushi domain-containing protein n=1 Tax=Channa striata TaxID=64152 RepID=A0AA88NA66_CHASR|nr:hypothetical protein Q5P01_007948 [Channa striata]
MTSVGWKILLLSCAALVTAQVSKKCSAPPRYPHTRVDKKLLIGHRFSDGHKVYYHCTKNYTPARGSRSVQCVDGKWTKLTLKCEKKSCGNAGDLPNGQFLYEGSSLIGEKVYATCNEGYTLKGLNYLICKNTGWTGEFPSCEEQEITCPTPAVANSVISAGNVSVYRVGDNVTVGCGEGFQLKGAQHITCGPRGQWQPQPPVCLPSPVKTTESHDRKAGGCGAAPTFPNLSPADKYITVTSFAPGDRVHYVCGVGYTPAGGSKYSTCKDGMWTPLHLKCQRKLCGSAGEIPNGELTYTGVEFGDTATASCDEGYTLVGRATRTCMSEGWDGRVAACEAVVCEEPPSVLNADTEGLHEPPYTYGSVLRYRCRVGTIKGQREISCTSAGTWSAPPPECRETTCPSPNVPHAAWRGPQNRMYEYRDSISILCNPGFSISGQNMVTCGSDGRWLPDLPKCRPVRHLYQRG